MKTLGPLMSDSFGIFQKFFATVLIGAVVFGVAGGAVQFSMQRWMRSQIPAALERTGFDEGRFKDLQERAQQGDQQAAQQLAAEVGGFVANQLQANGAFLGNFFGIGLRSILVSALFSWILISFAWIYFILIPTKGSSPSLLWGEVGQNILPMLGLNLWLVIRTFVWIPILGIFIAIIVGPRLALAPVILLTEKKGVFESASISYQRTAGWWDKVVGNIFVVAITVGILSAIASAILHLFGSFVGGLLAGITSMLAMAYYGIFLHELTLTISANARKV